MLEELDTLTTENEKSKIVNASMYIDALKSSGYKRTYNAIAEIVDNSIDAEASDIFIIGEQKIADNGEKKIVSFAFLDNGHGMDYATLKGCLTIGFTTNQERKGMGRFGVGLPQASVFVCNRVEVYSWQNGIDNCKKVYLDVDEVKKNNLNEIADPVNSSIPPEYKKFIKWNGADRSFDFSSNGTLVVWTKCTTIDHKKWTTCVRHMSEDLGRKYRYFLANGTKHITMIELTSSTEEVVYPNDPLYLMMPSQECVPDDVQVFIDGNYDSKKYDSSTGYTECLFELYKTSDNDTVELPIQYEENDEVKKGIVEIKYSVVKRKYYSKATLKTEKKPGQLPYGKSTRLINNTGISIVRNGREIDFGPFGFFNNYNVPDYRWWGIEISFKSDLDSAFGISNNKQYVNLKPMTKAEMAEVNHNELKTVWHQLADEIIPTIDKLTKRNSAIRGEEMVDDDLELAEASEIFNVVEKEIEEEPIVNNIPEDVKIQEAEEQLVKEGNENPSTVQIQKLIDSQVRVVSVYNKGKMDSFIDISHAAGTLSIILNANHVFYSKFVSGVFDKEETKVPFELFMIAVMRSIKKQYIANPDAMDTLLYDINERIAKYMMELVKRND